MADRTGRLRRAARLRRSWEFRSVARDGRRVASRHFVVLVASRAVPVAGDGPRLGLTVSRRVGNAVVRNRLKRRVREWFRRARAELEPGLDLVVIARRGASELSSRETGVELGDLLRRAGEAPG